MANQTTEFKRTVSGTINSGMRSVFGGEGRRYFIIEHKDDSALHRRGEQQKMIVDEVFIGRDKNRYSVKFNLGGLMRGNTDARTKYYHGAILDGYMTPNEARTLEGLERKDGLDYFLRPLSSEVVDPDTAPNE